MSTFTVIDVDTAASWYTQAIWRTSGVTIRVRNNTNSVRLLDAVVLQFVAGNTNGNSISFSGSTSTVIGTGKGTSLALYQNSQRVSEIVSIPNMPKANVYCSSGAGTSVNTDTWFRPRRMSNGTIQNLDDSWTYEKTQYSFKMLEPISVTANGSADFTILSTDSASDNTAIIQMGVITGEEASELLSFVWRYNATMKKWEKVLVPKQYTGGSWKDLTTLKKRTANSWENST